jgi:hypothetical protein
MSQPDFKAMSRKELSTYILEHREDDDAFYELMDRAEADPNPQYFPAPKSMDDLKHFPQLVEEHRRKVQEQSQE